MPLLTLQCWSCALGFFTLNDLSTHHLDAHERPLEWEDRQGVWEVTPPKERYVVPNHKAKAAQEWYSHVRNGVPYA